METYIVATLRGEVADALFGAMARTELAQVEARVEFLMANNATFEAVDFVVAAAVGKGMVEATRDPNNIKPAVTAWRSARRALALDADALLPLTA